MNRLAVVTLLVLALAAPSAFAADPGLQGLWKVVSLDNLTTGAKEASNRQYHMFSASHHMIALAGEGRPKLSKSFADMTAEEVRSQQPVGAGLYSYKRQGGKLIRTNILALSAFYEGKTFETEFEIKGDTLVLRDRHAAGGDLRQWTLERVE
jgi:hypothetical protein